MNRYLLIAVVILTVFITGCSSFLREGDSDSIRLKYQDRDFILLSDLVRNNATIPEGSSVRLVAVTADEWIKIYAYRSEEELLKSNRLLLLYMFKKDFPEERFSQERLDKEISKIVRERGAKETGKPVDKQGRKSKTKKVK